ncbi:PREDICTED: oxysterol-binding protein-related protein 1B-like [Camelina sativa]|uniref:Oxysterol-binding protein-related protein 1B-like n=1 Tax=Camelina sativa TaxID=90675 RepID=A0ABM1RQW0_CAMSA|nr:PREDICTED: oxysterol-binding protein-related protein 1B-like [Camelina sativa]
MEARVISCTTSGDDRVVKIAVPNHQAIAKYKAGENETTIVVSDDACSENGVKEIKKCCEKLGYVYEGRLNEEYTRTNTGPGLV